MSDVVRFPIERCFDGEDKKRPLKKDTATILSMATRRRWPPCDDETLVTTTGAAGK